ncbi:MAG: hypothetical protein HOD58_06660 [Gammaproteobacteria bacterium]|jgi:hypothetical protein|nr:hypothetical protein [Candidatus Neomarinimicrobiota bacterium]MBT4329588.1 hypothetical protein [Gammaproteobacteria bacterium]
MHLNKEQQDKVNKATAKGVLLIHGLGREEGMVALSTMTAIYALGVGETSQPPIDVNEVLDSIRECTESVVVTLLEELHES